MIATRSLGGIKFKINPYFLLLLIIYLLLGTSLQALLAFLLVVIHEAAHLLAAGRAGLTVSEIELFPFGGVARIDSFMEDNPRREMLVALAGPLSNFSLIILALCADSFVDLPVYWFALFCRLNLLLGIFNLLPALPLDGGRIIRAFWAKRIGLRRATVRAAYAGQFLAILIGAYSILGLFHGRAMLNGLILGVFLFYAAKKEADLSMFLFLRYLSRKPGEISRRRIMYSGVLTVGPQTEVGEIIELLVPRKYHFVIVVGEDGAVKKVLTESRIIDEALEKGMNIKLQEIK